MTRPQRIQILFSSIANFPWCIHIACRLHRSCNQLSYYH